MLKISDAWNTKLAGPSLEVQYSLAKDAMRRADEKYVELWGKGGEVGIDLDSASHAASWRLGIQQLLQGPYGSQLSSRSQHTVSARAAQPQAHVVCLLSPAWLLWLPLEHLLHRHQWVLRAVLLLWHARYVPRPGSPWAYCSLSLMLVCNLLFCSPYSCARSVFQVLPALGWQLFHSHLPHLRCSVLLDAHPGSTHSRLLAGKV